MWSRRTIWHCFGLIASIVGCGPREGATSGGVDSTDTSGTSTADPAVTTDGSSTGSNQSPNAENDVYTVGCDETLLVVSAEAGVLANDVDPEGGALQASASALTNAGGAVTMSPDGGFTYMPPNGYRGVDEFTYTAVDPNGAADQGLVELQVQSGAVQLSEVAEGIGGFVINGSAITDELAYGGDVNGDGAGDILVAMSEGAGLYVVFGKNDTTQVQISDVVAGSAGFVIHAEGAGDGAFVSGDSDINGDGLADIVVGAPGADGEGEDLGRIYVVFGREETSPIELSDVAAGSGGFLIRGDGEKPFGQFVHTTGDVNGDGLDDIIAGSFGALDGTGRAYVIHGKTSTAPVDITDLMTGNGGFAVTGEGPKDFFGDGVARATDVNDDGLAEVVVRAGGFDLEHSIYDHRTRYYVIFGRTATAPMMASDVASGAQGWVVDSEGSGFMVLAEGWVDDADGDGIGDLLLGASAAEVGDLQSAGRAYLVTESMGPVVGLSEVVGGVGGFAIDGYASAGSVGASVAGVGDVDGDGLAELLIGAPQLSATAEKSGRAFLIYGKPDSNTVDLAGITCGDSGFAIDAEASFEYIGHTVDSGDVDGDGVADFLLWTWNRVYVVFGKDFRGTTTHAGTEADDVVVGTPAADSLLGGRGDDVLDGQGGGDILRAGAGNDVLVIADNDFIRLSGGTGTDTLRYVGSVPLDLTSKSDLLLTGVEVIELSGGDAQAVKLQLRDIRLLSNTSNTITIDGGPEDSVEADLSAGNLTYLGVQDGYKVWGDDTVSLRIAQAVVTNVTL